jgi:hypothetical protein
MATTSTSRRVYTLAVSGLLLFACTRNAQEAPEPVNTIYFEAIDETILEIGSLSMTIQPSVGPILTFKLLNGGVTVSLQQAEILDNSTYGYPDALLVGDEVSETGNWRTSSGVLGSANGNAGQFTGTGKRFLGFRFKNAENNFQYGWVKLYCNSSNTRLEVLSYAYSTVPNTPILAGQFNSNVRGPAGTPTPIMNLSDILGNYQSEQYPDAPPCHITIEAATDPAFDFTVQFFPFMWPFPKIPGRIIDGNLLLPSFDYEGNMPSPGGADRLYWASFSGTGTMLIQDGKTLIQWKIDYNKTGFMNEKYNGTFLMERCD